MAGSFISIRLDQREWLRTQRGIEALIRDPHALWIDIGEYLQLSTDDRFERRVSPDGVPWAAVSDEYAAAKRAGRATARRGAITDPGQVLQLTRDMRRLTRYQVEGDQLQFGSDRIQAASMHFGDPTRNLQARPWLGLSDVDEVEVSDLMQEHLIDAAKGF